MSDEDTIDDDDYDDDGDDDDDDDDDDDFSHPNAVHERPCPKSIGRMCC